MMTRLSAAMLPLSLALLSAAIPLGAAAQSADPAIKTYSAGSPQTLPAPVVFRIPTTFAAPPENPNAGLSRLDRLRSEAQVRAERYAQQQAFTKRFGAGRPVKLRAPRY
jgi:hypothetical protein